MHSMSGRVTSSAPIVKQSHPPTIPRSNNKTKLNKLKHKSQQQNKIRNSGSINEINKTNTLNKLQQSAAGRSQSPVIPYNFDNSNTNISSNEEGSKKIDDKSVLIQSIDFVRPILTTPISERFCARCRPFDVSTLGMQHVDNDPYKNDSIKQHAVVTPVMQPMFDLDDSDDSSDDDSMDHENNLTNNMMATPSPLIAIADSPLHSNNNNNKNNAASNNNNTNMNTDARKSLTSAIDDAATPIESTNELDEYTDNEVAVFNNDNGHTDTVRPPKSITTGTTSSSIHDEDVDALDDLPLASRSKKSARQNNPANVKSTMKSPSAHKQSIELSKKSTTRSISDKHSASTSSNQLPVPASNDKLSKPIDKTVDKSKPTDRSNSSIDSATSQSNKKIPIKSSVSNDNIATSNKSAARSSIKPTDEPSKSMIPDTARLSTPTNVSPAISVSAPTCDTTSSTISTTAAPASKITTSTTVDTTAKSPINNDIKIKTVSTDTPADATTNTASNNTTTISYTATVTDTKSTISNGTTTNLSTSTAAPITTSSTRTSDKSSTSTHTTRRDRSSSSERSYHKHKSRDHSYERLPSNDIRRSSRRSRSRSNERYRERDRDYHRQRSRSRDRYYDDTQRKRYRSRSPDRYERDRYSRHSGSYDKYGKYNHTNNGDSKRSRYDSDTYRLSNSEKYELISLINRQISKLQSKLSRDSSLTKQYLLYQLQYVTLNIDCLINDSNTALTIDSVMKLFDFDSQLLKERMYSGVIVSQRLKSFLLYRQYDVCMKQFNKSQLIDYKQHLHTLKDKYPTAIQQTIPSKLFDLTIQLITGNECHASALELWNKSCALGKSENCPMYGLNNELQYNTIHHIMEYTNRTLIDISKQYNILIQHL